jgi:hypothetical protein
MDAAGGLGVGEHLVEVPLIPVCGEDGRVLAWLREKVNPSIPAMIQRSVTIGFERRGKLVGAAVFKDHDGADIELAYCHLQPESSDLGAYFRASVFGYAFGQVGCRRVSTAARADDANALKAIADYGFKLEARLREAADGDTDVLLFGMLVGECAHLPRVH